MDVFIRHMGMSSEDTGKIYYWEMADEPLHEEDFEEDYGYPKPDDAERSNLYLVAHSLLPR